jgi:hypothetical protein
LFPYQEKRRLFQQEASLLRPKKHACPSLIDPERLEKDLHSPDETARAKAVGSLCPCRVGIGIFQQHLDTVAQFRKDPSPAVRAAALHVFEDAGEMENEGYPTSPRETTNEMLRRRRASRFLPDDIEERREWKSKPVKGRRRGEAPLPW